MTQKHKIKKRAVKIPGMRTKMLVYLSAFTAIVLLVIWLLQIVLLDDIYQLIKQSQIKHAAQSIDLGEEESALKNSIYDLAQSESICISVYRISDGTGREIISAHGQAYCMIHSAPPESFVGGIYSSASEVGAFTEVYSAEGRKGADNLISARLEASGEDELLLVLDSEIQPVSATVTTLRYLFLWITLILAVVSVVMSFIISSRVTRPVAKMNEEAKRLAAGHYDVDFAGGAFRETAELAATLNYAASELSKLDAMQRELISNISHDLRTPLTMISGYSEVMRDIPGEMTGENMQVIIDETARLSSLVSDMLDLSRLTDGQRKIITTRFSLSEAVRRTLERYSRLREREGYKFIFESDGEYFVSGDETLILQVIYNLVNNAINYTGDDKTVRVNLTADGGKCRVSVTDTGEGISPERLPLIWDRYYTSGDYHKRGICGTGLGLSIVKKALIMHNAQFGVISTVQRDGSSEHGSTFWFELELDEDNQS